MDNRSRSGESPASAKGDHHLATDPPLDDRDDPRWPVYSPRSNVPLWRLPMPEARASLTGQRGSPLGLRASSFEKAGIELIAVD